MAIATTTAIALALAAAAAGTSYYNTQKTAKNADNALATQIRNQGSKQKEADAKVNEEVAKLKASRSDDERQKALTGYLDTLRGGKAQLEKGLTPDFGSATFQADAAKSAQGVEQFAQDRAGLMSRVDASLDQRRGEGYDYGRLDTDLGLIGREARGQDFLDQLAVQKASRRNAGLDALSAFLGGAAGGVSSMGSGASGQYTAPISGVTYPTNGMKAGWWNAYGAGGH